MVPLDNRDLISSCFEYAQTGSNDSNQTHNSMGFGIRCEAVRHEVKYEGVQPEHAWLNALAHSSVWRIAVPTSNPCGSSTRAPSIMADTATAADCMARRQGVSNKSTSRRRARYALQLSASAKDLLTRPVYIRIKSGPKVVKRKSYICTIAVDFLYTQKADTDDWPTMQRP